MLVPYLSLSRHECHAIGTARQLNFALRFKGLIAMDLVCQFKVIGDNTQNQSLIRRVAWVSRFSRLGTSIINRTGNSCAVLRRIRPGLERRETRGTRPSLLWRELPNFAPAGSGRLRSRAVEVALSVQCHAAGGIIPSIVGVEVVEIGVDPGTARGRQFEHVAETQGSVCVACKVQIAGRIHGRGVRCPPSPERAVSVR